MRKIITITFVAFCPAGSAHAHGLSANEDAAQWTFDPWVTGFLIGIGAAYLLGIARLGRRGGRARSGQYWQSLAFAAGWFTVAGALTSPLHWLGERLLTFHMIEHEILMAVSAPLLVMAKPVGVTLWALPRRIRLTTGRAMRRPALREAWDFMTNGTNSTVLHGLAIWAWHAPVLFDAAAQDVFLHRLQHLSFFATAVLFWWSVLRRSAAGLAAWHVFLTMLHTSALGALMALAPRVVYRSQPETEAFWGLTPLDDQQLAGLVMWVPAGTIYAGTALLLLAIWIGRAGQQARTDHVVRIS
jgi:putative membrane protein